jgi:hypothetical protein
MYSKIAEILDEYFPNKWFLDSGSLLGVIRDGKFLSSDVGIDISVLIENHQSPMMEECVSKLKKEGLVVARMQLFGITYKYCLVPKKGNKIPFAFDLHMFKLSGEDYLCPNVKKHEKYLTKIGGLKRRLRSGAMITEMKGGMTGFFERCFIYLYRDVFEYFGRPVSPNHDVKDENIYKWVIPRKLIRGVERESHYGLNVLKDCDDYLTYRYGDWHTPVSDWVTIRDDGGFKKSSVDEMRHFLENNHVEK